MSAIFRASGSLFALENLQRIEGSKNSLCSQMSASRLSPIIKDLFGKVLGFTKASSKIFGFGFLTPCHSGINYMTK